MKNKLLMMFDDMGDEEGDGIEIVDDEDFDREDGEDKIIKGE